MPKNSGGSTFGKALGTIAAWAGVAALSYTFHSFGIFTSDGAIGMVIVGLILTGWIWNN